MPLSVRSSLGLVVALLAVAALRAQTGPGGERPTPLVPVKLASRQELDHAEALKLYGLAVLHERNNRLLEAVRLLEEARRLDPDSPAIPKSLFPLYLALDRVEDGLSAARRALELTPDDFDTAYQYARQLRALDRPGDALPVLSQAAAVPALKEHPDVRAQLCFDLGVLHENAGDWGKAEEAFRQVVEVLDHPQALLEQGPYNKEEITSQAAETYERLGRLGLKAGHPDRAVAAFREAQKRDPDRAGRLAYNLAEVYGSQGKHREALASVDDYLRTRPQGIDGYEMKITLQRKLDRAADIVPDLKAAVADDKYNTALRILLAREYRKARQPGEAEKVYEELIKQAPTGEVYRGLFDLYKEDARGGAGRALRLFNDALKRARTEEEREKDEPAGNPKERETAAAQVRAMLTALREDPALVKRMLPLALRRTEPDNLTGQTRLLLATLASRTKQLEEAEALYRACLTRPGGMRGIEHEVYAGLLRVLWEAHKPAEIIAVCEGGLEKAQATNRVMFHHNLARAHALLNHSKEALADADAAVNEAGEKDILVCRRLRVDVLTQAEQFDKALAECQALLKEYNQPGDVREIRYTLSGVHTAARNHAKAEEQLELILEQDPNDPTANNDLGYLWADQNKRLDEAEKLIRKALDLDRKQRTSGTQVAPDSDRDNAAYVDSLGWVLFRRGKLKEARAELEKAADLPGGSDDPVVWDHLGDICFKMELRDKAAEAWKKALALYEDGHRRRTDGRVDEIKQKLRLLEP
jgi:tetratricopeptide (TPR) repeat protein